MMRAALAILALASSPVLGCEWRLPPECPVLKNWTENGSFEVEGPGGPTDADEWGQDAPVVRSDAYPPTDGAFVLEVGPGRADQGHPAEIEGREVRQSISYRKVRAEGAPAKGVLRITFPTGDVLLFFPENEPLDTWKTATITATVPVGSPRIFEVANLGLEGDPDAALWIVDDARVETEEDDAVNKARQVEQKIAELVAEVQSPLPTKVAVREPGDPIEHPLPMAFVYWEGALDLERHQLHRKRATAPFMVEFWHKGPMDQVKDELLDQADAIEAKLETAIGGLGLGLGFVDDVLVASKEVFEAPHKVHRDLRLIAIRTVVVFDYDRSSP